MKTPLALTLLALLGGCVSSRTPSGAARDFDWRAHDYERRQYWSRDCDHHGRGYNDHNGHNGKTASGEAGRHD